MVNVGVGGLSGWRVWRINAGWAVNVQGKNSRVQEGNKMIPDKYVGPKAVLTEEAGHWGAT